MPSPTIINRKFSFQNSDYIIIDGFKINYGMLNVPMFTDVDNFLKQNPDYVLVSKKAFSCNYRDKSTIIFGSSQLEPDTPFSFFGSEFTGEIIAKGKNVKNLSIGCRVIPNGCYPGLGLPTDYASREFEYLPSNSLFQINDMMSDIFGAAFTIGAQTSYSIIEKLELNPNEETKILLWSPNSNTSLFLLEGLRSNKNVKIFGLSTSLFFADELKSKGMHDIYIYDVFDKSTIQYEMLIDTVGRFDIVIDPYSDLHLMASMNILKMGGKYVTCGIANQHNLYSSNNTFSEIHWKNVLPQIIAKNIKIIGNCLGSTQHLESAFKDFCDGKINIKIDSIHNENSVFSFLNRTYLAPDRFGKVVYTF